MRMETQDLVRLGKRIEEARELAQKSARELADAVGISPAYLRTIERGKNPKTSKPSQPAADVVRSLAKQLRLDSAELLRLAGYSPVPPAEPTGEVPARKAVEDLIRGIQEAAKGLNRRSPFMYLRAADRLEKFATDFRLISSGKLRCGPEEEPHFTRLAVKECEHELRAVSYQDNTWWSSDAGARYLDLHEDLKGRVDMTRVFIVDDADILPLIPTLKRHLELEIETYVLLKTDVDHYYWRDFVLYDDALVRTARSSEQVGSDAKTAEFSDQPNEISDAVADFKALVEIAKANLSDAARLLARLAHQQDHQ